MKATTFSILLLALSLPCFAQTPGGPVTPPAQPQPAAQPQTPSQPEPAAQPQAPEPANPAPAAAPEQPAAVDSSKIVVPMDTTIPMMLMTTINTRSAFVGQSIYCESIYPITVGNRVIIPKGTSIRGTVTEVVRPGHMKNRAKLGLRFDEMILPNGTTRHLRATLAGFGSAGNEGFNPKEGQVEGGGSKDAAGKIERTAIPGAEIGTLAGLGNGHAIEGLGIGAGAGTAAGIAWILATRNNYIVLPHGTSLDLLLSDAVSFDREEVEPPSRYDAGPALPRRGY